MKSKYLIYTLSVAFCIASCGKSFLEITPKGKFLASKVSDYDLLFQNTTLINTGTSPANAQVPMGDEVAVVDPYFNGAQLRTQRLFRWEDKVYNDDEDAFEMLAIMPQLYTYNKIINEVMDAQGGSVEQKEALRAEGKANRAWAFFMLCNYYGAPYSTTTASTALSIPLLTEADVAKTSFQRASVADIYDHMVKDLSESIPYLPENPALRTRMSRAAAEALLAKVYLFMGKYEESLSSMDQALNNLPTTFATQLYDLNITMAIGGTWGYDPNWALTSYQSLYPPAWNNIENLFPKQHGLNGWNSELSDILLSPEALSLFSANDQRLKFFTPQPSGGGKFAVAGLRRRNSGTQAQFGVRLAEMYLIRAEANARLGNTAEAIKDLETLRVKRMPALEAKVTITDKNLLIKFVIEERLREFALQGQRWFDMRRLSVDPLFKEKQYTHVYYDTNGQEKERITLRPERLIMRFPEKVMNENPGMINNP
ncbi:MULTISPECIES: RagB/SusD family nutrient uptake outer membrane protein [Sphingobacterium]|uniref:RagB/SusD family nutrient uptake outer membrane protein n=1 Tax=Sphingobacterium TaxID=28453 RepID=UPI00104306F2|nr:MULTISPECIES: RagB/SusD family nutrient uptake outer membrane protein [Sphingobacterium]MCW2263109.1 tetratricopeptide (TPR) repeat protein [Sphingobacterium kitahiroshimense]TCR11907.1 SusD-like starch-binding protein associating with outer membrane [Sphingobacterium sp. JUb78]